jgi:hypothetical protein
MVFVQSLTSARFNGMPRRAIDAGLADIIAPIEELPGCRRFSCPCGKILEKTGLTAASLLSFQFLQVKL